jgi:hypothetical protein
MIIGRGFGRSNVVHKAVFENNLALISRLINC